jgi:integrase
VTKRTGDADSRRLDAAPAQFLDEFEEMRMNLSNDQLVAEAIEVNHRGVGDEKTLERYRGHLIHFGAYLASKGVDYYGARSKHVRLFMSHLEKQGGSKPHSARVQCSWCKQRGYPDGRSGPGWSASYRKSYLSAIKFLYYHFQSEEDLPNHQPSALEAAPKCAHKLGYILSREDVKRLLDGEGSTKARLIACWIFYAPSRRKTFADALWSDIDLDQGTWEVVGKYDEVDVFVLAPPLVRALRLHRRQQLAEAEQNTAMRDALSDPDRAHVLLTTTGKPMTPMNVYKTLRRHAVRAGVGVRDAPSKWDSAAGKTSRVTPHALRRTWATLALNDEDDPVPIDVVAEVLKHKSIATTRRHYAPTKPKRAQEALLKMRV